MNLQPFFEASFAIQLHMIVAFAALFLGSAILWRRKGGSTHKLLGRIWVGLMLVVSISGLFIFEIRLWGNFSPIHLLSIFVPAALFNAVLRARRGEIEAHSRAMRSIFIGAMAIAGGLTLLPGRMTNDILFGESTIDVFEMSGSWLVPFVVAGVIAIYYSLRQNKNS